MKTLLKNVFSKLGGLFGTSVRRRLCCLVLLCLAALGDFFYSGLARRTMVFYSDLDGTMLVEERMLHGFKDREADIRHYLEEVLLGPASPGSAPLFPRETRLETYMYRDEIVYADLSESAALPVSKNVSAFRGLLTLNEGIRRNFSYIKDVRIFIGGNSVFFEEFREIFANSADNSKTAP